MEKINKIKEDFINTSGVCKTKPGIIHSTCPKITNGTQCMTEKDWLGQGACSWTSGTTSGGTSGVCKTKPGIVHSTCPKITNETQCTTEKDWAGQGACNWTPGTENSSGTV